MQGTTAILVLVLWSAVSVAQPNLDETNFRMNIGDHYYIHQTDYQDPGGGGADLFWDFSTLPLTAIDTLEVIDPLDSPFGDNFGNASVALKTISDVHVYYSQEETGVYTEGNASPSAWTPFIDPKLQYMLPATLNSNTSDDYYKVTDSGNGTEIISEGTTNLVADAYGTLVMPFGTYTDVLRFVRTEENISMTIADQDTTFVPTTLIQHFYVCEQSGWALLELNENIVDGVSFYGAIAIEPDVVVSIEETEGADLEVELFPNPSSGQVTIRVNANDYAPWKLRIVGQRGRTILRDTGLGNLDHLLDLQNLTPGNYTVELLLDNGTVVRHSLILQ